MAVSFYIKISIGKGKHEYFIEMLASFHVNISNVTAKNMNISLNSNKLPCKNQQHFGKTITISLKRQ